MFSALRKKIEGTASTVTTGNHGVSNKEKDYESDESEDDDFLRDEIVDSLPESSLKVSMSEVEPMKLMKQALELYQQHSKPHENFYIHNQCLGQKNHIEKLIKDLTTYKSKGKDSEKKNKLQADLLAIIDGSFIGNISALIDQVSKESKSLNAILKKNDNLKVIQGIQELMEEKKALIIAYKQAQNKESEKFAFIKEILDELNYLANNEFQKSIVTQLIDIIQGTYKEDTLFVYDEISTLQSNTELRETIKKYPLFFVALHELGNQSFEIVPDLAAMLSQTGISDEQQEKFLIKGASASAENANRNNKKNDLLLKSGESTSEQNSDEDSDSESDEEFFDSDNNTKNVPQPKRIPVPKVDAKKEMKAYLSRRYAGLVCFPDMHSKQNELLCDKLIKELSQYESTKIDADASLRKQLRDSLISIVNGTFIGSISEVLDEAKKVNKLNALLNQYADVFDATLELTDEMEKKIKEYRNALTDASTYSLQSEYFSEINELILELSNWPFAPELGKNIIDIIMGFSNDKNKDFFHKISSNDKRLLAEFNIAQAFEGDLEQRPRMDTQVPDNSNTIPVRVYTAEEQRSELTDIIKKYAVVFFALSELSWSEISKKTREMLRQDKKNQSLVVNLKENVHEKKRRAGQIFKNSANFLHEEIRDLSSNARTITTQVARSVASNVKNPKAELLTGQSNIGHMSSQSTEATSSAEILTALQVTTSPENSVKLAFNEKEQKISGDESKNFEGITTEDTNIAYPTETAEIILERKLYRSAFLSGESNLKSLSEVTEEQTFEPAENKPCSSVLEVSCEESTEVINNNILNPQVQPGHSANNLTDTLVSQVSVQQPTAIHTNNDAVENSAATPLSPQKQSIDKSNILFRELTNNDKELKISVSDLIKLVKEDYYQQRKAGGWRLFCQNGSKTISQLQALVKGLESNVMLSLENIKEAIHRTELKFNKGKSNGTNFVLTKIKVHFDKQEQEKQSSSPSIFSS